MIDLIGDDHVPPFISRGQKRKNDIDQDEEVRLGELNNYGRKKVSADFSDSKFADRVELCCDECVHRGVRGSRRCMNPACVCHVRV